MLPLASGVSIRLRSVATAPGGSTPCPRKAAGAIRRDVCAIEPLHRWRNTGHSSQSALQGSSYMRREHPGQPLSTRNLVNRRRSSSSNRRVEAEVELQRALSFYRSVGATRYIREGEALFAASA
jgi:hypothetical protein